MTDWLDRAGGRVGAVGRKRKREMSVQTLAEQIAEKRHILMAELPKQLPELEQQLQQLRTRLGDPKAFGPDEVNALRDARDEEASIQQRIDDIRSGRRLQQFEAFVKRITQPAPAPAPAAPPIQAAPPTPPPAALAAPEQPPADAVSSINKKPAMFPFLVEATATASALTSHGDSNGNGNGDGRRRAGLTVAPSPSRTPEPAAAEPNPASPGSGGVGPFAGASGAYADPTLLKLAETGADVHVGDDDLLDEDSEFFDILAMQKTLDCQANKRRRLGIQDPKTVTVAFGVTASASVSGDWHAKNKEAAAPQQQQQWTSEQPLLPQEQRRRPGRQAVLLQSPEQLERQFVATASVAQQSTHIYSPIRTSPDALDVTHCAPQTVAAWRQRFSQHDRVAMRELDEFTDSLMDWSLVTPQQAEKDVCRYCRHPLVHAEDAATMSCEECGRDCKPYWDTTSTSVAFNSKVSISSFQYVRNSHFDAILAHFEPEAYIDIPEYVYDTIRRDARMDGAAACSGEISVLKIKEVLKTHELTQYYGNIVQIYSHLNNKLAPSLSEQQKNTLRTLFNRIREPFEKFKGARKNFLSYSLVFVKLCELLGYTEFCSWFDLLKSGKKLAVQMDVWERICKELNWPFHRSN